MEIQLAGPVVLLCLVPDSGHALPLVRMGLLLQSAGVAVVFVCPDEMAPLAQPHLAQVVSFGPVRPEGYQRSLQRIASSSSKEREIWLNRWFDRRYIEPIQAAVYGCRARLLEILGNFRPALVVADDHLFREFCQVLVQQCDSRLVLHYSAGTSYRFLARKPWMRPASGSGGLMRAAGWLGLRVLHNSERIFQPKQFRAVVKRRVYLQHEWRRVREELTIEMDAVPHIGCGLIELEERYLDGQLQLLRKMVSFPPNPPVGGQAMSDDLRDWLSAGGKIVYVCFGTMAPTQFSFARHLIKVCLEYGYRVLWASPTPPKALARFDVAQVRWDKWVPQVAVLESPAVVGFVTHAGAGSVQEALWFGKPVICVPLTWDQPYNAWVAETLGFGKQLPKRHLTASMIAEAMEALREGGAVTAAARRYSEEVRRHSRQTLLVDFLISHAIK